MLTPAQAGSTRVKDYITKPSRSEDTPCDYPFASHEQPRNERSPPGEWERAMSRPASGRAELGDDCAVHEGAVIAPPEVSGDPPVIGDGATVRSGTVVYPDVEIGENFITGHDALVREHTEIGDDCTVGTKTVIDGYTSVGDRVSMQTGVYVPSYTDIGNDIFLGPNAVLTNDPYPIRDDGELVGPTLEDHVSVGANATIVPNITLGEQSFVAAGAVVLEDVPPRSLAVGVPAEMRPLPDHLDRGNDIR